MEIPTKEIIERLESRLIGGIAGPIALDAIDTINAQSKEILELQATICRLREEMQIKEEFDIILHYLPLKVIVVPLGDHLVDLSMLIKILMY